MISRRRPRANSPLKSWAVVGSPQASILPRGGGASLRRPAAARVGSAATSRGPPRFGVIGLVTSSSPVHGVNMSATDSLAVSPRVLAGALCGAGVTAICLVPGFARTGLRRVQLPQQRWQGNCTFWQLPRLPGPSTFCTSTGSNGSCYDPDAWWHVSCDVNIDCTHDCSGACNPTGSGC